MLLLQRIVSLLPSATEILVALGAGGHLVARTTYDTDPALRPLPVVGGAADASVEAIVSTAPDVVIAWDVATDARLSWQLERAGIRVVTLPAFDTTDLFTSLTRIGQLVRRDSAALALGARLRGELLDVRRSVAHLPRPTVLYVAWNNPLMTVGPRTFVGQVISIAGGTTIFPDVKQDWPIVGMETVVRRQPEILVFPTGEMRGVDLKDLKRLPGWRDLSAVRQGRVVRLPIELVNRPGPRVDEAARTLRDALHPGVARAR